MLSTYVIFAALVILGIAIGLLIASLVRERPMPAHGHPKLYFARVEYEGFSIEGNITIMNLNAGQQVKVTARFKDKFGNPAPIQPGSAVWASDATDKATVEALPETPDADGKVFETSAIVKTVGPEGAAQINLDADGDLGDGVIDIKASGAVNVLAGTAAVAEIEFSTPEDIPPTV